MQKKHIKELLQDLEQELLRLGYTEGSMKFYRNRWQKILQFAEERKEIFYSEQLGIDYVESHYQISKKDFDKTLSQKDTQELRIIRMIGDFQLHHTVLRRYYKHSDLLKDPYYIGVNNDFREYVIHGFSLNTSLEQFLL
ncbi:MAG TPA: hypothetical protein VFC79_04075 [Tissierellaceae bacterium]|nr:hypothetical protein [Tissierellaceae bacterium]